MLRARAATVRRTAAALCGALALHAPPVSAQAPPPAERSHVYSAYEQETIDDVLASLHATPEPDAEGKIVEAVDVVPIDVFEKRDVLPRWLNVFHTTTRPSIVRREMLIREGERYRQVLADDAIRNLRNLPQLSVVLVVTAKGSAPDRVRVVVITKDVWSLRLGWDLQLTPSSTGNPLQGLEAFELQPAEWNVAGVHQTANGFFLLEPSAYQLGLGYQIPRLGDSRIAVVSGANVAFNRTTQSPEGSDGQLIAGQPIYSGLTEWAWDAATTWTDLVARRYQNGELAVFVDPRRGRSVPFEYRDREYDAAYHVTRSFGWAVKHDFTLGGGIALATFRTNFPGADPRTVEDFTNFAVPNDLTRVGPSLEYHTYTKRYARLLDFESLVLQEDVSLGHDVIVRFYPTFRALGSTLDLFSVYAAAQYTFPVGDGIARFSVASTTEPTPSTLYDASINPNVHVASPTFAGLGRLVLDGSMLYRYRDGMNITGACPGLSTFDPFSQCAVFLGGTNRLRGFPSNFLVGKDFAAYTAEFRSRPIEILSCQIGAVAFVDGGDAFDSFSGYRSMQSAGVGLRALFPWLDREVFSADIGFPMVRPIDASTGLPIPSYGFLISFGQAFDPPVVFPPSVLPTGQAAW